MSKGKKYTPEQIIVKLREAEILCGKGQTQKAGSELSLDNAILKDVNSKNW